MGAKLQSERLQAGLCIWCGKRPPMHKIQACESCRDKKLEYAKRSRERKTEAQICVGCGSNKLVTKRHCAECRDKHNKITMDRYGRLRDEVFTAYGGYVCKCCGEDEPAFLTIDHINGGGNKHRREIGMSGLYWWLHRNKYPSGFQVLCMNCQWGRKNCNGLCPHQKEQST